MPRGRRVLFAQGSGSSRSGPRINDVAQVLRDRSPDWLIFGTRTGVAPVCGDKIGALVSDSGHADRAVFANLQRRALKNASLTG